MYGWTYADARSGSGRSRRVAAPSRFRPVGYRAGGPNPQPGPNPAAGPGTQPVTGPGASGAPQPTPAPQPGPAPVAPKLPSSGGLDLGAAIQGAIAHFAGAGQVLLGAGFLGVGLLLLLSETSAGGELARGTRRAAVRAGKLALTRGLVK